MWALRRPPLLKAGAEESEEERGRVEVLGVSPEGKEERLGTSWAVRPVPEVWEKQLEEEEEEEEEEV